MNSEPVVTADRVSLRFGAQPVLREMTLSINKGETFAIIGESGCGKTVFLKLIVRLLRPDAGRILFEGRDLAERSAAELVPIRRRFGFLFQGAALFDSLSVFENIAYPLRRPAQPARPGHWRSGARTAEGSGIAGRCGFQDAGRVVGWNAQARRPRTGAGLDPEVMLYDEPTTGLDPIMTELINDLIVQTRERRPVTSVVVTHEMKTVRRVADRVAMLYPLARLGEAEPQVIFEGPPAGLESSADERVRRFAT